MLPPFDVGERELPIKQDPVNYTINNITIINLQPPSPRLPAPPPPNNRTQIVLAIIALVSAVLVALIQFKPLEKKENPLPVSIAGRVIDEKSNPVSRAEITITGRPERCVSEDNGNFTIDLNPPPADKQVRLLISKAGYDSVDQFALLPPANNLTILMKRRR